MFYTPYNDTPLKGNTMKTKKSILNDEDTSMIYDLMSEFFGTLKVDSVYSELSQHED